MKKQLNVDTIRNELQGGSAFFPSYKGNSPTPPPVIQNHIEETQQTQQLPVEQPVPRTVPRPVPGTPYPVPLKRRMRQRQPFDIYEDQYEALKQAAEEDKELGLPGSMSALVRKGIDLALEARKQGKI